MFHCDGCDPRTLGGDGYAEAALAVVQSPSQQRHLTEARATLAWLARETVAGNLEHVVSEYGDRSQIDVQ
ncbi:MAG: hypothetical protein IH613_08545 [Desulfuromonadales bacterium]|nr:hypothetical protein [Desulfuromonadales bacterium]